MRNNKDITSPWKNVYWLKKKKRQENENGYARIWKKKWKLYKSWQTGKYSNYLSGISHAHLLSENRSLLKFCIPFSIFRSFPWPWSTSHYLYICTRTQSICMFFFVLCLKCFVVSRIAWKGIDCLFRLYFLQCKQSSNYTIAQQEQQPRPVPDSRCWRRLSFSAAFSRLLSNSE